MEAKELRIGNIVKGPSVEFQIISPKQLDYAFELQPIPLTEEWLFKFGFTYEYWRVDETKKYYCYNTFDVFIWDEIIVLSGYNWRVDIQYVHQLQNLYFDLTGEELIIQP